MVVGCAEGLRLREEKRERPDDCFRRPKTSDVWTNYNVAIVIRWGIKQTPNALKLGTRPTSNITRPHAKSHPIPRTFSGHLKNTFSNVPRARASVSGLRTDNGRNGETRADASFEKHDDAIHMMT